MWPPAQSFINRTRNSPAEARWKVIPIAARNIPHHFSNHTVRCNTETGEMPRPTYLLRGDRLAVTVTGYSKKRKCFPTRSLFISSLYAGTVSLKSTVRFSTLFSTISSPIIPQLPLWPRARRWSKRLRLPRFRSRIVEVMKEKPKQRNSTHAF
jgi:hypothetical protein